MTKTELFELLRNGENSGVEFKRDVVENRALAKELVAFSNFQGGKVLLGVEDDGTVVGITRDNLEEWIMTACRDKIRPELLPYYTLVRQVEGDRDVAVVEVRTGWTVHSVWHNQHRTYYIRVGTLSREASQEELERLFQQKSGFRAELRPVSGSSVNDLDLRRVRDYFGRIRDQEIPDENAGVAEWQDLLIRTEFLSEEGDSPAANVAGLLLFGNNPNRFLTHAGIDAAAYLGTEKDYAAVERTQIRGAFVPLYGPAEGGDGEDEDRIARPRRGYQVVENGLVEQAVDFVRRNTQVTGQLENGARRVEERTYPDEAVREALVNALVHRDYLLSATDIELSLYEDRLEVVSPGRLPNGITPDRMLAGIRAARNERLKDVMRDYGYLEHMGMGIPRKIVRRMREHNGTVPDLIEDDERFVVRLWKEPRQQ